MTRFLPGSAAMTIIFGFALYLWLGSFDPAVLAGSNWGLTLLAALVLSLVALGIGLVYGVAGSKRMLAHLNEDACTHGPEVGRLAKTLDISSIVGFVLGLVIIALMVVATTNAFA
jgi:hypothetical protein